MKDDLDYCFERDIVTGAAALRGQPHHVGIEEREQRCKRKSRFISPRPSIIQATTCTSGTPCCTVAADAMARFKRQTGYDVMFTAPTSTGKRSRAVPKRPASRRSSLWTRSLAASKSSWELMDISYDDFIRTTETAPREGRAEDLSTSSTSRGISTRANTRAGTARRANRSGWSVSSSTAVAPTAAAPSSAPRRKATSSSSQVRRPFDRVHQCAR